ncbi:ATP-binding protein [Lepagella muris]|uniref:ATP-binding protein n=1 Tax=Lepagella muris TaxID=3032870 RepID=A0AC61RN89_9BACT|nr:AAA family ATPase [Lepagella muris]ROT02975.1 ATP-binding protein [Muribaculaceae bacterium Isolate-037 (Harlan)]TGY80295.1 ATP-binding protein [Lepagella muris]THG52834.1 ATP-binding protein [Bacteroidales bacterium]TKC58716.1 ATP-binding protein [Bacteroidales bacterium]
MIFKRKLYDEMLKWKQDSKGSTALLIKGARRVGKSTLAQTFAEQEYKSYVAIDFASCRMEIRELFDDVSDLDYLFMRMQVLLGIELHERDSVIVFDEVQYCPKARQAIKYLVADGRYDYIETGSLISIRQNVKGILIPSEEEEMILNPLDYEEFQWALGNKVSIPIMRKLFESNKGIGDAGARGEMRNLRLYMLVGGMPQAVRTYLETNNMEKVDKMKRSIINLYEKDFIKIDPSGNTSKMFMAIPSQLASNWSRYQIYSATDGGRPDRLREQVFDMQDSMVVNLAYHANDPNVGFALHRDGNRFKMFMADTGLFITLAFWDKKFTENIIYEKLLSDKLSADLGYVYENLVAQMLKANGHELYYYTWPSDTSNHLYEVDFLLSNGTKIVPIEVKSSGYKTHKSLDLFCEKFSSRVSKRYLIYTKDLRKEESITYLPVYMTQFL